MGETKFTRAAVIGTGMMGPGIAVTLALGGIRTVLISRTSECALKGLQKARSDARLLEAYDIYTPGRVTYALELLTTSTNLEETVAAADLVIESAPADM